MVLPFWLFPGLFLLLYVTHYRKMGEALFIKGHLFELTPVIAHIECVAAVVWLLGAATVLVLHLVRYYRVEHYIKSTGCRRKNGCSSLRQGQRSV